MGETRDVPVVLRLYDLVLWTMNHTARFPRHHRYSLGQRIEGTLQDLLELLIEARYAREKADLLDRANLLLERFRFQMRLAKDLKALALNSFEFQAKSVEEIGRMIGGWRKHAAGKPSPPWGEGRDERSESGVRG
jgi:hypothetical protein